MLASAGITSYADTDEVGGGGSVDGWVSVTDNISTDPATNNIVYTTVDQERTSNTYYHTVAYTIARATVDSNGKLVETEPRQEITVYLDNTKYVEYENNAVGGQVALNKWTIKYDAMLDTIKTQFPDWYAELVTAPTNKTLALKLDPVLNLTINGDILGGLNPTEVTKYNIAEYAKLYSWLNKFAVKKFDRGLIKQLAEAVAAGEMTAEEAMKKLEEEKTFTSGKHIGKDTPNYYTFNWNPKGQFDLGDAIPTSEDVRNGYQADAWYGQALVNQKKASNEWTFQGYLRWKREVSVQTGTHTDPVTGNIEADYSTVTIHESEHYAYTVERAVAYWFLTYAEFYDLEHVTDENTVFPTGTHEFNDKTGVIDMDCTINGEDLTTSTSYDSMPDDNYHVDWADADKSRGNHRHDTPEMDSKGAAQAEFDSYSESMIKTAYDIFVQNDQLSIDGHTYMNGARHEYRNGQDAGYVGQTWAYSEIAESDYRFADERQDTGMTGDAERIPPTIKNKEYTTTITVNYKQRITPSGTHTESKSGKGAILPEAVPTGIGKDFPSQEPIRVHTPVISPVVLLDPDTGNQLDVHSVAEYKKTQLVDGSVEGFGDAYNENADYQLLLDGTYTIKFDITKHLEHLGYDTAAHNDALNTEIYNKYTKRRFVCFPFIVQVDGQVYYPDETTTEATDDKPGKEAGYTDWIEVYKDDADGHDEDTVDFYVPTWAIEGFAYTVQYMVVPENATKEDFDMYRKEPVKNVSEPFVVGDGHLYNYMATYTMEVQLSGLIYDFQIVGINEKDIFEGYKESEDGNLYSHGLADSTSDFPFCPTKQEKKQGSLNRIGGASVRYTFDGTLTNDWKQENVLPMSNGSSLKYKKAGVLRKGDQFGFTVRTIANLWDEEGDEIYIKPTFRYVSYDGTTVKDDINVYYTKVTDTDAMEYVKYGSEQDLSSLLKTSIDNQKFRGSFYQQDPSLDRTLHALQEDDADFSKDMANRLLYELKHPTNSQWPQEVYKTTQIYLHKEAECSTLSSIKLTNELRLLTGNLEQLEQNLELAGAGNLTYVKTKDENKVSYDITKTSEPETWESFRKSMQTWFGTYHIPSALHVTDKDVDVWEYASEHGNIRGNEDIFYDDGYLVLNFDIYTKNNGNWHLKYYGTNDGKNQWNVQGPKTSAKVGDPTTGHEIDIPLIPGDVAIIDMGQSKMDDFTVGKYITN